MKKILLALLLCLLLPSCERLELPDGTDGSGQTSAGMGDESLGDTLSVAQAQRCPNDTLILVEGYIVGYINGTSMTSGATLSLPKSSPNSNMLLADAPDETDQTQCLPVKLEDSNNYGFRSALNLYDHPEKFRQKVLLLSWIGTYFRTTGVTRVYGYEWQEAEGSGSDTPVSEEGEDTPGLDNEEEILQGR